MHRSVNRVKAIGLLAAGSTLFQFGGCSIDAFFNQAQIGFAQTFGGIPAQVIYDLTIGQFVDNIVGGGDDGTSGA